MPCASEQRRVAARSPSRPVAYEEAVGPPGELPETPLTRATTTLTPTSTPPIARNALARGVTPHPPGRGSHASRSSSPRCPTRPALAVRRRSRQTCATDDRTPRTGAPGEARGSCAARLESIRSAADARGRRETEGAGELEVNAALPRRPGVRGRQDRRRTSDGGVPNGLTRPHHGARTGATQQTPPRRARGPRRTTSRVRSLPGITPASHEYGRATSRWRTSPSQLNTPRNGRMPVRSSWNRRSDRIEAASPAGSPFTPAAGCSVPASVRSRSVRSHPLPLRAPLRPGTAGRPLPRCP